MIQALLNIKLKLLLDEVASRSESKLNDKFTIAVKLM